ncbi:hypothetical protein I8752_24480 [Nostocaceae cyanobacterium CENA369]|uniref:Uncharacterized protein n=1 Tax=Dendronalium phyllosphericum CENA369 TaxID=1725256 RepID=A0A8J7IHY6_9NOST|nr:hypothetical protein [Dendronalium phyllosphericum]MBH8576092.1 hypothetical protein [Dendronalium phyllosphericum CENA369]
MNQDTYIVEELDPLVFCETWGLSYEEASKYLKIKARTMAAYACNGKVTKRNPSSRVKALAAMQHNIWIQQGKHPLTYSPSFN